MIRLTAPSRIIITALLGFGFIISLGVSYYPLSHVLAEEDVGTLSDDKSSGEAHNN